MEEATGSAADDMLWLQKSPPQASPGSTAEAGEVKGDTCIQAGRAGESHGVVADTLSGVEEGTLSERDVDLDRSAEQGFVRDSQQQEEAWSGAGDCADVTRFKRLCVEYRYGQKRLAEAWLSHVSILIGDR